MSSIRFPAGVDSRSVSAWLGAWRQVREADSLEIRLEPSGFVTPTGIVLSAAAIAWRKTRGLRTSLVPVGDRGEGFRYLQRIDFFAELGTEQQEGFERRPPADRFVPLRRISDLRTARQLADATGECLETQLPDIGPSPLRMARFVFEELGANIVQHSGAPETGFGMAQAYPHASRLEIAFADAGIGFRASLERNPELEGRIADDSEALQLALGQAVSGGVRPRQNMGMGLALLASFADLTSGSLWIASGQALLHRRSTVGTQRANLLSSTPGWDGSIVVLNAVLSAPADRGPSD